MLVQFSHANLRSLSSAAAFRKAWLMHVCLFSHTFAGLVRFCEVTEMVRKLMEEYAAYDSDSSSDYCSAVGESDVASTCSGFESASEGYAEEERDCWDEDLDLGPCFAAPCEEEVGISEAERPAWLGTRGHSPRSVTFDGDCGSDGGAEVAVDYRLVDGSWHYAE